MKKINFSLWMIILILPALSTFAQTTNFQMQSVKSFPHATFEIKAFDFNPGEGYTIEIDNNECGHSNSEYLSRPVSYNSVSYNEKAGGFTKENGVFRFTTPFTIEDLGSKWLRWRVKDNKGGVSEWKCYSWSDYCTSFLNPDGSCKKK